MRLNLIELEGVRWRSLWYGTCVLRQPDIQQLHRALTS